jgi:hypothetical protein
VREQGVKEETDAEIAEAEVEHDQGEESIKPVYLKGLFSVSTTSSRPLPVIRADIIRVLKQLGVSYTEIKGGFHCWQAPRLSAQGPTNPTSPGLVPPGAGDKTHRRKISFTGFKNSSERERDEVRDQSARSPQPPKTPQRPTKDGSPAISDTESESNVEDRRLRGTTAAARDAGATSTHVRDEVPRSMVLDFEIFIVKVPLLSLHGIQFKKVDGNIMHYKNMAQKILAALRL